MSDQFIRWTMRCPEELPRRVKLAAVACGLPIGTYLSAVIDEYEDRQQRMDQR